jgi:hypothetical protein
MDAIDGQLTFLQFDSKVERRRRHRGEIVEQPESRAQSLYRPAGPPPTSNFSKSKSGWNESGSVPYMATLKDGPPKPSPSLS